MKKWTINFNSKCIFLLLFLVCVSQAGAVECGDANSSGETDIIDALILAQYYVGLPVPNFEASVADVNDDNVIDILDALLVAQFYVGLISQLPGCTQTPAPEPSPTQGDSILWNIDSTDTIGGFPVTVLGNPKVIEIPGGEKAVEFDGVDDGLIVDANPLAGAEEFTVEVMFNPYSGGPKEQRFVHMQQNNNNRILIELRSPRNDKWFLDTFMKSGSSSRVLYAKNFEHDTDQYTHASLVYKNGTMSHYVNGVIELSDSMTYQQVTSGQTSIGVRLNKNSWFKGYISKIKVTPRALAPAEFMN